MARFLWEPGICPALSHALRGALHRPPGISRGRCTGRRRSGPGGAKVLGYPAGK